ncbi:hypothetical protein ACFL6S_16895 [Candidatus Poribacteria bacterium]
MEKTFVNALAYSRLLKSVIIVVLVFVVVVDIYIISLVMKVIGHATPEERTKIISLLVLLLLSSAAGFPFFYLIHRSFRKQWIKINDEGITYNSWSRKISASWDEVIGASVVSRGRYGQALRTKGLRIDTKKGKIYALPIFVDSSMPIPQLKMGISSQRLLYPDGRIELVDLETSDICTELRNHIPELLNMPL